MRIRRCLSEGEQKAALDSPISAQQQELARLSAAIAHPVRLRILAILRERSVCMCGDLVGELPLSQSTVSEHLRVLKDAGLVRTEIDGNRTCYSIDESGLRRFQGLVSEI